MVAQCSARLEVGFYWLRIGKTHSTLCYNVVIGKRNKRLVESSLSLVPGFYVPFSIHGVLLQRIHTENTVSRVHGERWIEDFLLFSPLLN